MLKMNLRKLTKSKPHLAKHINFPKEAWEKATRRSIYHSKTNSLDELLPDIYLKAPTGGENLWWLITPLTIFKKPISKNKQACFLGCAVYSN
jgi:hypothetical protein